MNRLVSLFKSGNPVRTVGTCNELELIELRQRDNCYLDVSIDNGLNWIQFADIRLCADLAIQDAIANGGLGVPQQPGPGGEIPYSQCHIYEVELAANQKWICPVPVGGGYTIIVENAAGGWWDGSINDFIWSCPNGADYSLGGCVGSPEPADPGDPLQSAPHMRLVGNIGTSWFDAYNTTYEVPQGTPLSDLFLQANDSTLSDNQGSIRLKITVCNAGTWCYEFDFTASDGGWLVRLPPAVWQSGQGWQANENVYIYRSMVPTVIQHYEVSWVAAAPTQPYQGASLNAEYQSGSILNERNDAIANVGGTITWDGTANVDKLRVDINIDPAYPITVTRVLVSGLGSNPFGASNCP